MGSSGMILAKGGKCHIKWDIIAGCLKLLLACYQKLDIINILFAFNDERWLTELAQSPSTPIERLATQTDSSFRRRD
jgi:hypothetical protein